MYVIGCWFLVAHLVFLIFYRAFKIQLEMTKRCKEAECWTLSGKSTHSSWKIRLLLIVFGTYTAKSSLQCALLSDFLNIFEPQTLWTIDPLDYRPFGPMTLLSDQWLFGLMNLWTNALELGQQVSTFFSESNWLSVTCIRSVVFSEYFGSLHQ
jgi:hypothetical protein